MQQVLNGIPNVISICDDILIHGQSQEEHDIALNAVIERLVGKGLTLNKSKCKLNQTDVKFLGFVFDKSGVRCHPKRIEGVKKLQPPQNAADTLSFLSMMQYSPRFIRDFSSISEPLRKLTRSSQPWE